MIGLIGYCMLILILILIFISKSFRPVFVWQQIEYRKSFDNLCSPGPDCLARILCPGRASLLRSQIMLVIRMIGGGNEACHHNYKTRCSCISSILIGLAGF